MVAPLILGIFLLIVLYFYFWYITIPVTIIIIVIIWWSGKNKRKTSRSKRRTYYKQSTTENRNSDYYQRHAYEDLYDEDDLNDEELYEQFGGCTDEFGEKISYDEFRKLSEQEDQIEKDKLVRTRLEKFNFSEEEAELVFGKEWRDMLGQHHHRLFAEVHLIKAQVLFPPNLDGTVPGLKSIRKKVSHFIDKVIRMIESVLNEDPEYAKKWVEHYVEDKANYEYINAEWEFFKIHKKTRAEYSENILDPSEAYKILDLAVTATVEQVKKKYRELVLKWHPDTYKGDKTVAEKMMMKVNQAYETIMEAA